MWETLSLWTWTWERSCEIRTAELYKKTSTRQTLSWTDRVMSKWGDMFDPLHQKLCPCFGAVTSSELLPLALLRWSQTDLSRLNLKWLQRPPILHQTSGHQFQFLACEKSCNLVAETKVIAPLATSMWPKIIIFAPLSNHNKSRFLRPNSHHHSSLTEIHFFCFSTSPFQRRLWWEKDLKFGVILGTPLGYMSIQLEKKRTEKFWKLKTAG